MTIVMVVGRLSTYLENDQNHRGNVLENSPMGECPRGGNVRVPENVRRNDNLKCPDTLSMYMYIVQMLNVLCLHSCYISVYLVT